MARVTVPENHVAVIIPERLASELVSLAFLIRHTRRPDPQDKMAMYNVAGDLLIALLDAGVDCARPKS